MLKGREHFGMIIRLLQNLQSYTASCTSCKKTNPNKRAAEVLSSYIFLFFHILTETSFSETSEAFF